MRTFACASFALIAFTLTAQAEIKYQYVAEAAEATAAPGKPALVKIYLEETVTGSSKPMLKAEDGLFVGGFKMVRKCGDATVVFEKNPAFGGPAFAAPITADKDTGNATYGVAFQSPGVPAFTPKDKKATGKVARVLIATAKITPGDAAESVFELQVRGDTGALTNLHKCPLDASKKKGDKSHSDPPFTIPEDYTGAGDVAPFVLTVKKGTTKKSK